VLRSSFFYRLHHVVHEMLTITLSFYNAHDTRYRYFTVGRELLGVTRPKLPAANCLLAVPGTPDVCKDSQINFGWTQLPMTAALLGHAALAQKAVMDRATGGPAVGYRFIGFGPHCQDYEPAADQFANMNSGLQYV
jgi:hypothetical protein